MNLDGGAYSTSTRVAASPGGVNHILTWNAMADLGAGVITNVLLRARAGDLTLLGDWSLPTPFQINMNQDSNGNGIPDWWELYYFRNLLRTGNGDYDGDGFTDRAEYIADTGPTDANSYLRIEVQPVPGGVRLDWTGGIWATQNLQRILSFDGTNQWLNIFTASPPTPISGSYTDFFGTNTLRFYRLETIRP